jgi:hypothetical protein
MNLSGLIMYAWIRRLLLACAFIVALALAFAGYLRPAFVVDLANRFILCL